MIADQLTVTQGTKILWEGTVREVSYALTYIGIDGDWNEAEIRGNAVTEQMIQDWLINMSCKGKISYISPLQFVQNFEYGAAQVFDYENSNASHLIKNPVSFSDIKDFCAEAAGRTKPKFQERCLIHKAIKLNFDATGSTERAQRILRAYEEQYGFIHLDNGNWSCQNSQGKVYQLYIDISKSMGYCECADFQSRGLKDKMPCKHLYGYLVQDSKIKETIKRRVNEYNI
jgi:predicted nucleic acid-binding Zn finger protein